MSRQLLQNLIGDIDRLLTAGAASVRGHEKLRVRRTQIAALSVRIPALAPLGDLIAEVVASDAPAAAVSLLKLATRTRAIRSAICGAESVPGELTPLPTAIEFASDTPVFQVVRTTRQLERSAQYRRNIARGTETLPLADLRVVGALMDLIRSGDSAIDEIVPRLDRSFAAELLRGGIEPTNPSDYRRLIGASRLDTLAARAAVLELAPELRKYFES